MPPSKLRSLSRSPRSRSWARARILGVCLAVTAAAPAAASTLRHVYRLEERVEVHGAELRAGALPRTWERGRPEIPYDVVTFLVSPRASWVVGTSVVVDGGQSRSF